VFIIYLDLFVNKIRTTRRKTGGSYIKIGKDIYKGGFM